MATLPDDYDPYLFRSVEFPLTNLDTFINLIKSFIGAGLLSMPMAFHNAGWIMGLIGTGIITFLLIYAMNLLLRGMYMVCKWERVPELIYSEAMGAGLKYGPRCCQVGRMVVVYLTDFFLGLFSFGVCAIYVVFIAETIKQVLETHVSFELDLRIYMAIMTVPFILIYLIRDLKHLVPFSAIANVLIFLGICFVFYYVFSGLGPLSEIKTFQTIDLLPLFFGVVLFAMEAPGVVVALEANMAKPQDYLGFTGILSIGMFIVAALYTLVGFFGYWRYGDDIRGSITLNIPEDEILSQLVKGMFALAIYFSYPLQGYVVIDILCHRYILKRVKETRHILTEYLVRIIVAICTVIAGIGIPKLGLFLSLIGSLCLSSLGLIFPALIDICVKYQTGYGPIKIYLLRDIFLFAFGIFGGAVGTATAIIDIIESYT